MSSDVVLTSALRTNLQSLQNTQRLIDETQLKLATGLAVNSALDNPQNFFAAQSLNNRAGDLSRLLDGIGQSVRTIEQANNGIESLTSLVEQAESIATSALEATTSASESTSITGNVDISDFELSSTYNGGDLAFTAANNQGQSIALSNATISLSTGDTEQTIINAINNITETSSGDNVFRASLSDSGRLQIETLIEDVGFNLQIDGDGSATTATAQSLASELGLGALARLDDPTNTTSTVSVTSRAATNVTSASLYSDAAGTTLAQRSSTLDSLRRDGATTAGFQDTQILTLTNSSTNGGTTETFNIEIGINGTARQQLSVDGNTTVQGLIDSINNNSVLNSQIEAGFDESTGQITFTSLTTEVESVEFAASVSDSDTDADAAIATDFGFGVLGAQSETRTTTTSNAEQTSTVESIRVSGGSGEIAQLENDFNTLREQIDTLVGDSDYRGTNLLNGDDLTTTFDEDRTNTLTTEGVDFTTTGIGIDGATFAAGSSSIDNTLSQVRSALTSVRDFGSSIANDLAIIETRRDFTENTINTLESGADDLTVADQNEEGANLLALQTRQQLGVTSLSLASQSQQAVLRLF